MTLSCPKQKGEKSTTTSHQKVSVYVHNTTFNILINFFLIDEKNCKKDDSDDDQTNESTIVEASKSACEMPTTSSDSEKISKPESDELEERFIVSMIYINSPP